MANFAGIPDSFAQFDQSNIILQSIPYDGTSTWGKGADKGFHSFLESAKNMELYDIETDFEVYKKGIFMPDPWTGFTDPTSMFQTVYRNTKELLKTEKFLTFFGGEHSISIGVMKAFYEHIEALTIVQIDAHADLRPSYNGSPYNHACALHDANHNSHVVQLGIRSMDSTEKEHMHYENVFFAHQMQENNDWMEKSIQLMKDNVYITFDLDAFDPSIMPSTGTPEPGGLDWWTTLKYLKQLFAAKNVVGFDIVELAPIDHLSAPQFLAAKLYYKMLSYKFANHGK